MASSTVLRKSFRLIGSSPLDSRWEFMTVRRYFVTVTPGTATGYWKAMKRPIRARSSGSASVMSSPLKQIVPSVTSRFGCPMITFASVDLPEPLGPMSAWISPLFTSRSRPLRISFSPALTYRFLISRSANGGRLLVRKFDELRERRLLKCLEHAALDAGPEQLRCAAVPVVDLVGASDVTGGVAAEAVHRRDWALERLDDLLHVDGGRRP